MGDSRRRASDGSYATGFVYGVENVGGLVGETRGDIRNSYYAARGRNNGLGEERTFAQLRCPTTATAPCLLEPLESTYEEWDRGVWDFGSATDLPQLSGNRNSDLNLKPYIKGSAELVVGTGYTGVTRLSLEADYPGTPRESVSLTWSLSGVPSTLIDFVYFELEDGTTGREANGSSVTLSVVRDGLTAGRSFYAVLRNNVSANGDRVRVRTEQAKQPYILRKVIGPVVVGATRTFSFFVGYAGTPGERVTLTWSLSGVPPSLRHLVYFDLVGDTTSTTFTDIGKLTTDASTVTLVVVGSERLSELAGKGFDVVLKNDISENVDRFTVRIEGANPMVVGGREQTETIPDASASATLSFSATDPDSPDSGGAGLSWDFFSRDGIAEGSAVVFSGTTKGGTVKVEVSRSSLGSVGSFVLEVASPVGVKTTLTVTIKTVCSTEPGVDLMAGQKGTGEPGAPYQIKRLCQLQDVRSNPGAYYGLVKTIDASETKDWNSGAGFEPIASFSGSFVSTGSYVISSLTISLSGTDDVGLFSRLAKGATIRNVILVGSRVTGRNNVGLLVGVSAGVIEGCSVTGSVFGSGDNVGGLVGSNGEGASVSRSHAASTVTGTDLVGGLVGESLGSISNSYAASTVTGVNDVGGLVGTKPHQGCTDS